MVDAILVINAGSSSIKFAGYAAAADDGDLIPLGKGQISGLRTAPVFKVEDETGEALGEHHWPTGAPLPHEQGIQFIMDWIHSNATETRIAAVGHRVVHGGLLYSRPVLLDDGVLADLDRFVSLAPLHQPHNLNAIRALAKMLPGLPQVACFDTAFHRTQQPLAQIFAIPRDLTEHGVRRYGFHGLSYEYISGKLPEYVPDVHKVVVAHLGSGASMCAMVDGKSVESSMGFTAVDGLPMGTRPGALDPGVVLYFMQELGWHADRIESLLYKESGLLGVSGVSNDMRLLLASDKPEAAEAVDLFVYHIAKQACALASAMEGLDALVFTAGIGEHAGPVRAAVCRRLAWFGIDLDAAANDAGGPRISTPGSRVSAWVIPTDEERMIAMHTANVLAGAA